MKLEKGFTLAELMGVIIILGVIALIVFPAVTKTIRTGKEKAYEEQKNIILKSARNWGVKNAERLSEFNSTYLSIDELKKEGYIEVTDIINPLNDKEMDGCVAISYDAEYNQYVYQYYEDDCDNVSKVPVITMNGDNYVEVSLGDAYNDLGASAVYDGKDISSDIVITGTVNTNKAGIYYVRYNVSYNEKKGDEVVRTVKVTSKTFAEIMTGRSDVAALDPGSNPRYVGADPDNYVWFNKDASGNPEKWRIIGLFDGQVKIIRNDRISQSAWDKGSSEGGTHGTYGWNDWSQATLQIELNNETNGYIKTIKTNDPASYSYIDLNHVWNLGGYDKSYETTGTRSAFYNAERGAMVYEGRPAIWTGAIGLMYPSDYGYSTSGTNEICDSTVMFDWDDVDNETVLVECMNKSWVYNIHYNCTWTITPALGHSSYVFDISYDGTIDDYMAYNFVTNVNPVVYLKSDVVIIAGTGDKNDPFKLGIE